MDTHEQAIYNAAIIIAKHQQFMQRNKALKIIIDQLNQESAAVSFQDRKIKALIHACYMSMEPIINLSKTGNSIKLDAAIPSNLSKAYTSQFDHPSILQIAKFMKTECDEIWQLQNTVGEDPRLNIQLCDLLGNLMPNLTRYLIDHQEKAGTS